MSTEDALPVELPPFDPAADIAPAITVNQPQQLGGTGSSRYLVVVASFGGVRQKFTVNLSAIGDPEPIPTNE